MTSERHDAQPAPGRAPGNVAAATPAAAARSLRARYRAAALRPDRRLGQHFLADLNLGRKIIDLLPPPAAGTVLEIGPGLGALTFLLLERGYRVVAIERDRRLASWLREAAAPWPGARILDGDVRATNLEQLAASTGMLDGMHGAAARGSDAAPLPAAEEDPAGAAAGAEEAAEEAEPEAAGLAVVGNLPYYATSEIVLRLLRWRHLLGDTVLTVQREVAERLTASPGSRVYGSLSVSLGLRARLELCLRLPRTAFWPAPDVDSAVIRLRWRRDGAPPPAGDAVPLPAVADGAVEQVVRAAFAQRRKLLEKSLSHALGVARPAAAAALEAAGIAMESRAEDVDPPGYARLAAVLVQMALVPAGAGGGAAPSRGACGDDRHPGEGSTQ